MFTKLTRAELDTYRSVARFPEYVAFLDGLKKGEGGEVDVAAAGVGRQVVKNRLNAAAETRGMRLRYLRLRSSGDTVVFEVEGAGGGTKQRRGVGKRAAG